MTKLVVLKLDGDLSMGVQVTLQISEEGKPSFIEMSGDLPSASDLPQVYDEWKDGFHRLGRAPRITEGTKIIDGRIITPEECLAKAELVRSRLNEWLGSPPFAGILKTCHRHLQPDDEVRVVIRTSSDSLRKLPWHLWDLIEEHPLAEVALSDTQYERPVFPPPPPRDRNKVKILAILGDSTGINVHEDRQVLENLPDAATTFLVEPHIEKINDQLWKEPYHILCFSGHSRSEGETGRIYINKKDSLTISELKQCLERAVSNGLQLAIFNSCDGLGLARTLHHLQIPLVIVMREPVPDQVAQRYLKYVLTAFSKGETFYLAERTARKRLEGLEREFPSASLLPGKDSGQGLDKRRIYSNLTT